MTARTQTEMLNAAERAIATLNNAMLELLYGDNPITDAELARLIERHPHKYARFAGYIGKRPGL